jgi:hypothetical protein
MEWPIAVVHRCFNDATGLGCSTQNCSTFFSFIMILLCEHTLQPVLGGLLWTPNMQGCADLHWNPLKPWAGGCVTPMKGPAALQPSRWVFCLPWMGMQWLCITILDLLFPLLRSHRPLPSAKAKPFVNWALCKYTPRIITITRSAIILVKQFYVLLIVAMTFSGWHQCVLRDRTSEKPG